MRTPCIPTYICFLPMCSLPCSSTYLFTPNSHSHVFGFFVSDFFLSAYKFAQSSLILKYPADATSFLVPILCVLSFKLKYLERVINMHRFHILTSYILVSPLPSCLCPHCSTKTALIEVIQDSLTVQMQPLWSTHTSYLFMIQMLQIVSCLRKLTLGFPKVCPRTISFER